MSARVLFIGNFLSAATRHRHYCEDLADRLESSGVTVVRTSRELSRTRRMVDMLWTIWRRRHDYDIAHIDVFSTSAFAWAEASAFALRRLGKPFILTLHGGDLPELARRSRRRVSRLLQSASLITAPSRYLRDAMAHLGFPIEVVPNAVDLGSFLRKPRDRVGPRLVWLRAFEALYNPLLAVETCLALVDRAADVQLTMIGADKDGSLAATRRRVTELGLEDRVTIVPGVPHAQVPHELARGDIFLSTSNADNSPLSVIEAMATGLCVVCTRVGGIPFLIEDGKNGLIVRPNDPAAMADAVERVLVAPDLAAAVSRGALATADAHDWSAVLQRWSAAFERVANG